MKIPRIYRGIDLKVVLFFLTSFVLVIFFTPLAALIIKANEAGSETFVFIFQHILRRTAWNSFLLSVSVGGTAFLIGTITAWLIVRYDFPGRQVFEWLLVLPLAFPAYIMAYTYTNFLDLAGPLQTVLRGLTGFSPQDMSFLNIRSFTGATLIMALCLYPYIYLMARTAFLKQTQSQLDAAYMLGANEWNLFWNVALPAARPYVFVGLALVLMETLADYGTVSFFGLQVFSTSIYNAWAGYGDVSASAKLSLILLLPVVCIFMFEQYNRSKMRFFGLDASSGLHGSGIKLGRLASLMAFAFCALPAIFGFAFPFLLLCMQGLEHAMDVGGLVALYATLNPLLNSLFLAGMSAFVGTSIALLLMGMYAHASQNTKSRVLNMLLTYGYAMPGIMIAMGFLIVAGWWGKMGGGLLTGSLVFIVMAYVIRFITIPVQALQAATEKIGPNIDDVGYMLAAGRWTHYWYVKLPLLLPALLSGLLVLFIDVMKELPITLILRPFDFDTLAIKAYNMAMDERLSAASIPSFIIVCAGLLPVILLTRLIRTSS
jgi:iron(III) transport system permease protein